MPPRDDHPLPEHADEAAVETFRVKPGAVRDVLATAIRQSGFSDPKIDELSGRATASRERRYNDQIGGVERKIFLAGWKSIDGSPGSCRVAWIIREEGNRRPGDDDRRKMRDFRAVLSSLLSAVAEAQPGAAGGASRDASRPPHNPVLAPGEILEGLYSGNLRDYSGCASVDEVADLRKGTLPLGRYAFGKTPADVRHGPALYLSRYRSGGRMEFNGTLICAPQNAGKTSMIVRWAEAANRDGYSIFLVDVKGNLRQKLAGKLRGHVYYFSTDPRAECDRMNFLRGVTAVTPEDTEEIKAIATALLPSAGWVDKGGEDEYFYRNRVIWLTGLIHILKLREAYAPDQFLDEAGRRRSADLGDLYRLVTDEQLLYAWIGELREAEAILRSIPNGPRVDCGVDHWIREIAQLIDPNRMPEGQRDPIHGYRDYTQGMVAALEPFSRHGTLFRKVRDSGPGRLFSLEDLGRTDQPVTIILAAREQDLEKAETVLALAVKKLQQFLFGRFEKAERDVRPVLLLLDETRRIRAFDANKYITFAREARAGCVIVYQSLDQIGDEKKVAEILENVGTQVYLGSLVGNTARYFMNILPRRYRASVSENLSYGSEGRSRTVNIGKELVDYLTTNELYNLPAGSWPALVYINDQPRRKPILVDMDDAAITRSG